MKLSVVIVNFNVKYYLEQTICSVYRAARNLELDVWVVRKINWHGYRVLVLLSASQDARSEEERMRQINKQVKSTAFAAILFTLL